MNWSNASVAKTIAILISQNKQKFRQTRYKCLIITLLYLVFHVNLRIIYNKKLHVVTKIHKIIWKGS